MSSVICLSLCVSITLAQVPANTAGDKTRIGVYDSRAIAVAFVSSDAYQASIGKQLAGMRAERDEAKAAGV